MTVGTVRSDPSPDGLDDPASAASARGPEVTGAWTITLDDRATFRRPGGPASGDGSDVSVDGLASFDVMVARFVAAPQVPTVLAELAGRSAAVPSVLHRPPRPGSAEPGVLVGMSYRTTLVEILGAVLDGLAADLAAAAHALGVDGPVTLRCEHPVAPVVAAVLAAMSGSTVRLDPARTGPRATGSGSEHAGLLRDMRVPLAELARVGGSS
ncbi:hypothetical protein [Nakamurella leprariae]|uniref:Uncharacterized protein n=1 Tax=Nakamurella leprariae TaxID=2803911 RepID=A0A939BY04_9ACTN|nr:hypothetical protein [Nakamurella leprariae]MBM9466555.1 hypothetical protein [Nakamurella leprariae]